jgi:hypothetical protein
MVQILKLTLSRPYYYGRLFYQSIVEIVAKLECKALALLLINLKVYTRKTY